MIFRTQSGSTVADSEEQSPSNTHAHHRAVREGGRLPFIDEPRAC
ncbi:hypothetical protein HSB1_43940 [Halogranum salarium B-1]|uniref:Uncharacterized protein n=1 Tax=Halogranum salarium B-1 TaxID=1210908 RepID=J2ZVE9_9EURY|nr:hypothetical protein HSB1_43940 [Halogranum salarium B-1]